MISCVGVIYNKKISLFIFRYGSYTVHTFFLLDCCDIIAVEGLFRNELLGVYNFNGTRINGRPLYMGPKPYAMWFNGESGTDANWIIGRISDLDMGKFNYGFIHNQQDTPCPDFDMTTKEWWESEFVIANITTKCVGMNKVE